MEVLGEARQVVIAREVTKLHEEFLRGRATDVLKTLRERDAVKGEITLLIGKAEGGRAESHGAGECSSESGADHGGREG